jgi:hypothetical protein
MILDGLLLTTTSSPTWRRKRYVAAPVVVRYTGTSLQSIRLDHQDVSDEVSSATATTTRGTNSILVERRTWLQQTANAAVVAAAASAGWQLGTAAQALADDDNDKMEAAAASRSGSSQSLAAPSPSKSRRSPLQATKALCDPTVSVWQLNGGSTTTAGTTTAAAAVAGRTIVLLGTAHISQLSAALAGTLVREIRPDAVFVELDLKRVARIGTSGGGTTTAAAKGPAGLLDTTDSLPVQVIVPSPQRLLPPPLPSMPVDGMTTTASSSSSSSSSPSSLVAPSSPSEGKKGNWFTRGAMNLAANAVGSAVKGLYSNLSTAGFQPGEEFATAIRAGQEVGAAIVLGDQDVQVTLRRLTQALAVTDLDKLLSPNSALEKSMAELLPPPPSSSVVKASATDTASFKQELTDYVERLKSRDSVRKLMAELNEVAPALIQVMLTERDAYMAAGLDTLSQFDCIVAVMGLAHQDGVERNLRERGWKPLPLSCAPYTV